MSDFFRIRFLLAFCLFCSLRVGFLLPVRILEQWPFGVFPLFPWAAFVRLCYVTEGGHVSSGFEVETP